MVKFIVWGGEGLALLLICVAVYSQMIRPLFRKTPVFPMFRRVPKLEQEIEAANEGLDVKAQKEVLAEKKRQLGE